MINGKNTFAQKVQEASKALEIISDLQANILTEENIRAIKYVSTLDLDKVMSASKKINKNRGLIQTVQAGLPEIGRVAEMKSQIQDVSDARQNIELVAGNIKEIGWLSLYHDDYTDAIKMFEPIQRVLEMNKDIGLVLENKDKIEDINLTVSGMQDALQNMEDMYLKNQQSLIEMRNIKKEIKEDREIISLKLDTMKVIEEQIKTFQVKTYMIEPDRKGYSKYSSTENILNLFIPMGQKGEPGEKGDTGRRGQKGNPGTAVDKGDIGDKGEPGRDGKNFRIDIFGETKDLRRFGNRPKGTSLLTLDESPTMIYFKKSDTLDDWTKGQPFGISDGEDANITVLDSQRVNGYTLEEIEYNILNNVKRMINEQ